MSAASLDPMSFSLDPVSFTPGPTMLFSPARARRLVPLAVPGRNPFAALSLETTVTIFDLALEDCPASRKVLMAVCSRWRSILYLVPACNRVIDFTCVYWSGGIDDVLSLRELGERCRLAAARFPHLLFDLRFAVLLASRGWDASHPFIVALWQELDAVCRVVSPRIRTLDVRGSSRVLARLLSRHSFWPALTNLCIHVEDDPFRALLACPALRAPLLRRFSSTYMSTCLISFLPADRITSLDLFSLKLPGFQDTSLEFFLHLLSAFPRLEDLAVALDDIEEQAADSGWHTNWRKSTLWGHFTAPSLELLSVPQRWFTMGALQDLGDFFKRNRRIPRSIRFVECPRSLLDVWQERHQACWNRSALQTDPSALLASNLSLYLVFVSPQYYLLPILLMVSPSPINTLTVRLLVHIFDITIRSRPTDREALRSVCTMWGRLIDGAPIDVLPNEIAIRIFDIVNGARPADRKALRAVCTTWNALVDGSAACNRFIDFFYVYRPDEDLGCLYRTAETVRRAIERARSALLDLRVCVHVRSFGWDPAAFSIKEILRELGVLCSVAAPRTRSLDVVGCPGIVAPIFSYVWPRLRDLSLHVSEDPSAAVRPGMFMSPLARFSTTFASPSIFSAFVHCNLVTTLELFSETSVGDNDEATLETFLLVLNTFPMLERLRTRLEDVVTVPPSGLVPYRHNSLRELYLTSPRPSSGSGWNPEWIVSMLWSFFEAPSLAELSMPQRWFVMGAFTELGLFFARSGCNPRLIQFVGCPGHLMEDWQCRHAAEWTTSVVQVRGIVACTGW
ncbi:hypothetical protein K438DRAFT_1747877 [Mycena galopus ATCC 62051]|nr:hypothetical protein K438DRAFT_1747877 [Mycena galopus ATCC 62051]